MIEVEAGEKEKGSKAEGRSLIYNRGARPKLAKQQQEAVKVKAALHTTNRGAIRTRQLPTRPAT